jgi:Mn2+/Fe2+ NRAMP family transporter
MLVAAYRKKIVGDYRHPLWLAIVGGLVVLVMTWLSAQVFAQQIGEWVS